MPRWLSPSNGLIKASRWPLSPWSGVFRCRALVESGLLTETDGHYELTGPLPEMAILSSLQDSFAARLDRLAPVRELAQIGAVLGREFTYDLIHAVSRMDDPKSQEGPGQLSTADILFQRGVPPDATYTFKHALLQDAAYASLLKSQRQQFHAQTATVLEQQHAETVAAHPELLAHHIRKRAWQNRPFRIGKRPAKKLYSARPIMKRAIS